MPYELPDKDDTKRTDDGLSRSGDKKEKGGYLKGILILVAIIGLAITLCRLIF